MKNIADNVELIWKNPRLVCKIIQNYCRIALRKPALGAVELAVTYDCNLNCEYCSSIALHQKGRAYLLFDEIKPIISQLVRAGACVINLTGGEPLLRKDTIDIAYFIKRNNALATILTNGHLLTKECAKELKKISLDAVQISINGIEKCEISSSLEKAFSGIENAKSRGLRVVISTIVTNENLNNGKIKETIEFCKNIRSVLNLIVPCAVGRWSGECGQLLKEGSWKIFQDLCKIKGVRTDTHMNYFGNLCPAGTERVYVSAYGDVLPCDFIHISFGNLKNQPLTDILKHMRNFVPIKHKNTPCLAGKDSAFIKDYLNHIQDKKLPYSYKDFNDIKTHEQ